MADAINFEMDAGNAESFTAADTDRSKWSREDHTEAGVAKGFLSHLQASYEGKELTNLANMLSTRVDDEGHALGDSRLFVRAAARAARQFDAMLRKREGGDREDGQPQLKYHMPLDQGQRVALQREAQSILERELMAARSEFIRRSGRSLPGWWR